jgi:phage terminase large subunit GpA-like protein
MMELQPHTVSLCKRIFRRLQPTEDISLAEWADKYRRLPPESSAEPGIWRTSRTPYLKKPMECITDPKVREVILMTSVQIGKSEVILNAMGYYAHIDPSSILLVQPTVLAGKDFSNERIDPTIRDTPVLKSVIGVAKSRDRKNTIMKKFFPGGYIAIVGANSPVGLASRPIKALLCDEIDRWPESAKKEGDPLTIVEKRTATYPYNKKIVKVSTPTIDGESRIQHEFNQGTMERWKLPCPGCGEFQELKWANIKFDHMRDSENGVLDKDGEVLCECPACGELNNEISWKNGSGEWFPENDNATIKSFHLSALASPWMTWREIAEEFLSSKGDSELMKVWTNTILGETWAETGEGLDWGVLLGRRERYGAAAPDGVLAITAGVDVQDDRFEMEVVGWGENKASWGIEYIVIHGDTEQPEAWDRLDQHLLKTYACGDGVTLPISRACIDSGHRTTAVYKFCKEREVRGVYAVKGKGGSGMNIHEKSEKHPFHHRDRHGKSLPIFPPCTDG